MSDQPEKQKNMSPDEDMRQEKSAPDAATPEPSVQDDESKGNSVEQEDSVDLSSELDDILENDDEFQEIDLFDEGLLDDIDQEAEPPGNNGSDASTADASDDVPNEPAAQDDGPDHQAEVSDNSGNDDLAEEIAADIAADLGQNDETEKMDEAPADDSIHVPEEEPASEGAPDSPDVKGEPKAADAASVAEKPHADEQEPISDGPDDSAAQKQEDLPDSEEKTPHVPDEEPDIELEPMEVDGSASGVTAREDPDGTSETRTNQEGKPASETDRDAFGDDLGISLSDDELWDDSGEDDIPLFDDEPDVPEPHGPGAHTVTSEQNASAGQTDGVSGDVSAGQGMAVGQDDDQPDESIQGANEVPDPEDVIVIGGAGPAWLPYFISGVASIVLLGGIFVLWGMLSSPVDAVSASDTKVVSENISPAARQDSAQTDRLKKQPLSSVQSKNEVTAIGDLPPMEGREEVETFDLAPFIIPVVRQGELVFFKLTVELVVPDMRTKQELKKREAWVRDAIYTELKGIDVGPGTKGEFLLKYRRPLKKRIEKELAPLEIKDVRLMGYVLK